MDGYDSSRRFAESVNSSIETARREFGSTRILMKFATAFLIFLLIELATVSALACFAPKPGFGWDKDELIQSSRTIVLAKLVKTDARRLKEGRIDVDLGAAHTLVPVEVLKGDSPKEIVFHSNRVQQKPSDDFNGHTEDRFWGDDVDRSEWPCCICGPDHGFIEGELYLLFPDAFGARKSAEAIKSEDDLWLAYVRESLEENSRPNKQ